MNFFLTYKFKDCLKATISISHSQSERHGYYNSEISVELLNHLSALFSSINNTLRLCTVHINLLQAMTIGDSGILGGHSDNISRLQTFYGKTP